MAETNSTSGYPVAGSVFIRQLRSTPRHPLWASRSTDGFLSKRSKHITRHRHGWMCLRGTGLHTQCPVRFVFGHNHYGQ